MNGTSLALVSAVAALLAATQVQAHAKLLSANPAGIAAVPAPKQIVLKFNEKLQPGFSGFEVSKGAMRVPMKAAVGKDRLTLVGTPGNRLRPGAYKVTWHAVTADAHRMQGAYSFTIR